jgi:putative DNA primase/helicase
MDAKAFPGSASSPINATEREAVRYARAKIPVLIVRGKLPLTANGLHDATTDETKIGTWFRQHPAAGIGLACGHTLRSGGYLLPLDVDVQHNGDHSLNLLEEEFGELPETWTVRTPSGGWHYYYKSEAPHATCIGFRPGLELRGVGAYVVAPPSPNYRVETAAAIVDAPEWLLRLTRASRAESAPTLALGESIPSGARDHTLTSLAGTMRRRGLEAEEILPTLSAVNARRCDPPLAERDLIRIPRSIARKPVGQPLVRGPGAP